MTGAPWPQRRELGGGLSIRLPLTGGRVRLGTTQATGAAAAGRRRGGAGAAPDRDRHERMLAEGCRARPPRPA